MFVIHQVNSNFAAARACDPLCHPFTACFSNIDNTLSWSLLPLRDEVPVVGKTSSTIAVWIEEEGKAWQHT